MGNGENPAKKRSRTAGRLSLPLLRILACGACAAEKNVTAGISDESVVYNGELRIREGEV